MRTRTRRLLSRKVSIGGMLEFGLWVGLGYLVIGMVWTFVNYDAVDRIEAELTPVLPAGADLIAFGLTTALWPQMLIASFVCGT